MKMMDLQSGFETPFEEERERERERPVTLVGFEDDGNISEKIAG